MREKTAVLLCSSLLFAAFQASIPKALADAHSKEWTFLVYLNGDNNLDSFGTMNLDQMERVGSTDDVNIIVQWASLAKKKTERLYIEKIDESNKVSSPVLEDMGKVDMGDWRSLVDFIEWGAANYPAKHYFVDVWDHGSGWHAITTMGFVPRPKAGMIFQPTDISWDDNTGNFITTLQLGQAINEASRSIGRKIDIYGSDACLMAMAEVADEMKDAVNYYVGSQEVEPGAGWPYDAFLKDLAARPTMAPREAAADIVKEYVNSYKNGENGSQEVTFSAFDLGGIDELSRAVASFGVQLGKLDKPSRAKIVSAAAGTQSFAYSDYGDLLDFLGQVKAAKVYALDGRSISDLEAAARDFIVADADTAQYSKATGLSIWLPNNPTDYDWNADKYKSLAFERETSWGEAMKYILQDASNRLPAPIP